MEEQNGIKAIITGYDHDTRDIRQDNESLLNVQITFAKGDSFQKHSEAAAALIHAIENDVALFHNPPQNRIYSNDEGIYVKPSIGSIPTKE
ncbi:hypothetical protein [Listeria booriae]|uniref:hypothetical protein n=1 Tax=Listeria booriae TaxID=1552123 RepID=UPI00164E4D50|nr:hypothetical protein [Listeria booriae]MBC6306435.1 hypothetical protein [Listeria booriae]